MGQTDASDIKIGHANDFFGNKVAYRVKEDNPCWRFCNPKEMLYDGANDLFVCTAHSLRI